MCVDVCPSHYEYHTSAFSPSCVNSLVLRRSHDLNADNVQSKINDVLPDCVCGMCSDGFSSGVSCQPD